MRRQPRGWALKSQDRSADVGAMSLSRRTRPLLSTGLAVMAAVGVLATVAPPASAGQRDPEPYVTGWLPYWNSSGVDAHRRQECAGLPRGVSVRVPRGLGVADRPDRRPGRVASHASLPPPGRCAGGAHRLDGTVGRRVRRHRVEPDPSVRPRPGTGPARRPVGRRRARPRLRVDQLRLRRGPGDRAQVLPGLRRPARAQAAEAGPSADGDGGFAHVGRRPQLVGVQLQPTRQGG